MKTKASRDPDLQQAYDALVEREAARTRQLVRANEKLKREISERIRVESALRESQRRIERLMANLPGMVYRSSCGSEPFTMEFVSQGCLRLTGYPPAAFTESPRLRFNDLVLSSYASGRQIVERALRERRPFQFSYQIKTATGEEKWVWEQGMGIYDESGAPVAIEGFISDFTVPKRTEQELHRKNKALRAGISRQHRYGGIVGQSRPMQQVYDLILKAAATDANVLVIGESGTGKELVARAIHDAGERSGRSFVAVNCGAVPETLVESEFFGHAKGAFTGAHADKPGYLARADGGTLFLDEVGDISLNMQAKLLRVLEERSFLPVGGTRPQRSDFRVVAATHRNLYELMEHKRMRLDFFYRISVVPITLPPLRDRREDIPLLVDHFLARSGKSRRHLALSGKALDTLVQHDWPGNVRELQNVIHRFLTVRSLDFLHPPVAAPIQTAGAVADGPSARTAADTSTFSLEAAEKQLIADTLRRVCWNRTKAAELLGISRRALYGRIKKYRL